MANTIRGAAVIFGGAVALITALTAALLALLAALGQAPFVTTATMLTSMAVLGVGGGAAMAVAGWRSWARRPALTLRLPSPWILLILFLATLAAGEVMLRVGLQFLLPAAHVVACLLPPAILISAVSRHLQRHGVVLSWRDLTGQFTYGAIGATAIAITLETVAVLAAFGLAAGGVALLGGSETMQALTEAMQSPTVMASPERLLDILFTPALALGLGLLVAVAIPLMEELVKSLGVPLAASLRPVDRAQAFAFGLMAGAGFSLTEALFYGLAGLPHSWAGPVLTRAGTVVIHGAATGLMGLAWYEAFHRRPARFAAYAAAGIALHGLWNGLGGLLALTTLNLTQSPDPLGEILPTALSAFTALALGVTWCAALALIVWQTHQCARATSPGQ